MVTRRYGLIQQQGRIWLRKSRALGVVLEDGAKSAATSSWLEVGMHKGSRAYMKRIYKAAGWICWKLVDDSTKSAHGVRGDQLV